MEFQEYIKIKNRMTKRNGCICETECKYCALSPLNNGQEMYCSLFEQNYPHEAEQIVQKWADEHPVKTRRDDLLKKFPNRQQYFKADTVKTILLGLPVICASSLGYCDECIHDCDKCWNTPINEGK